MQITGCDWYVRSNASGRCQAPTKHIKGNEKRILCSTRKDSEHEPLLQGTVTQEVFLEDDHCFGQCVVCWVEEIICSVFASVEGDD